MLIRVLIMLIRVLILPIRVLIMLMRVLIMLIEVLLLPFERGERPRQVCRAAWHAAQKRRPYPSACPLQQAGLPVLRSLRKKALDRIAL